MCKNTLRYFYVNFLDEYKYIYSSSLLYFLNDKEKKQIYIYSYLFVRFV